MDILNMCRICLVENVKMYSLVNTKLQDIYEKLTGVPLQTEDGKPLLVCYLCRATLQTCYRLHIKCIRSDKLLNQMLESNQIKLTLLKDSKTLTVKHPAVHLSYVPTIDDEVTHEKKIKEEFIEDAQKYIPIEELSIEYTGVGKIKTEVIDRDEVNETDDSVHVPPATDTLPTSYAELHIEYDIKQEPRDAEEDIRNDEAVIENDLELQYNSNVLLKPAQFVSNKPEVECVDKIAELLSRNAVKCRNYRNRKKAASLKVKKPPKTAAERARMYRLRKKLLAQESKLSTNEVLCTPSTSNSLEPQKY